ncbi:ABC transporter permease [Phycisphaerales bacterium AB-hyl4]|uniref:ABC transporter permease n=1 Tax=Natronomicrosphaera hydrolytica TaxID=3242702 RepID=A0ABV4UAL4_9BACT
MNVITTIARRELSSLFFSPIAYVVLALFTVGAALIFFTSFGQGAHATMRPTFEGVVWLLIFLAPAISMRLISDEFRSGTIEPLMTAPLNDMQVILGKWLGAMGFYLALLLPLVVLAIVLEIHAAPDRGPIVTGLIGLVLVGGLYMAIGIFASATTQNQIIAFLATVFIISLLTFLMFFLPRAGWVMPELRDAMFYLNVNGQFSDFNRGLIDLSNFAYFVTGIALFLFLAVKVLESKRWR